jgi:hypothetical protein
MKHSKTKIGGKKMGKFNLFRNIEKKEEQKKNDVKPCEIFNNVDEAMAYVKSTGFKRVES